MVKGKAEFMGDVLHGGPDSSQAEKMEYNPTFLQMLVGKANAQ